MKKSYTCDRIQLDDHNANTSFKTLYCFSKKKLRNIEKKNFLPLICYVRIFKIRIHHYLHVINLVSKQIHLKKNMARVTNAFCV